MWSVDTYQEICQAIDSYVKEGISTTAEELHEGLGICSPSDVLMVLEDAEKYDNLVYQTSDEQWHLTIRGLEEFSCFNLTRSP